MSPILVVQPSNDIYYNLVPLLSNLRHTSRPIQIVQPSLKWIYFILMEEIRRHPQIFRNQDPHKSQQFLLWSPRTKILHMVILNVSPIFPWWWWSRGNVKAGHVSLVSSLASVFRSSLFEWQSQAECWGWQHIRAQTRALQLSLLVNMLTPITTCQEQNQEKQGRAMSQLG